MNSATHAWSLYSLIILWPLGGAGAGKSRIIDSFTDWVNYICSGAETGDSGHLTDQPLVVKCAFTGSAADNIGGNTISKTFGLSFDGKHTSLTDRERDYRRGLFSKVSLLHNVDAAHVLLLGEISCHRWVQHGLFKSTVSDWRETAGSELFFYWIMLSSYCESLKELKQRNGVPFGGVSVILLGDSMQLKPVSCFKSQVSLVITGL